jgi:hypothetical protein
MLQHLEQKLGWPGAFHALRLRSAWLNPPAASPSPSLALAPSESAAPPGKPASPSDEDPRLPLRHCAATLDPFIHQSEAALTAIGAVMADLFAGAQHIRNDAEGFHLSIATLAENANAKLLEIAVSLRHSLTRLHESRALVTTLDRRLATVITDFAGLEAGVREFRVLATLIRIEGTTRSADSGDFVTISEQSSGIAANLAGLVQQIREATSALRVSFRSVSRELGRLNAQSQKTITTLLEQVTALEAAMAAEHQSLGGAAASTIAGLEGIRNSIGDLVCALQIHDILRQQTEHSLASLHELDQSPLLTPPDLYAGRAILHGQLANTVTLCQQAAENVEAGLQSAGQQLEHIATIAYGVSSLTSLDSPSQQTLRSSTAAILAALPAVEQGDAALAQALDGLLQGSASILDIAERVSFAMLNMRWLGLNTSIQSANHPQDGSAIEILGDRTAALAGAVDAECTHIRTALEQLRQDVDAYSRANVGSLSQQGIRPVIENSTALFTQLHSSMNAKMEQQTALQQSLRLKLDGAHQALAQFGDTLAAPARAAERLAPTAPLPEALSPAAAARFDAWLARYTMASERRVHCEALGLPFTETEPDASAEGDIELF